MGMINFNTLPKENTSQFAVIPKGSYIAKIAKSEMKTPKSEIPKPDYLNVECDITDPATNTSMGKFWIRLFESEANLPRFQLRRFIEALNLNITGEFELKDLTKMINGKSLVVDICPDKEGKNSIVDISADCFYPLSQLESQTYEERATVDAEINSVFTAPATAEPVPARAASY